MWDKLCICYFYLYLDTILKRLFFVNLYPDTFYFSTQITESERYVRWRSVTTITYLSVVGCREKLIVPSLHSHYSVLFTPYFFYFFIHLLRNPTQPVDGCGRYFRANFRLSIPSASRFNLPGGFSSRKSTIARRQTTDYFMSVQTRGYAYSSFFVDAAVKNSLSVKVIYS